MGKIISLKDVRKIVAKLKDDDKKIVLTGGAFDLFHAGHLKYLKKAANLGNALFVHIDSDSNVRARKGIGRPVNSEKIRAFLISNLDFVDYVFISGENYDNNSILSYVKPDVLVKVVRPELTTIERKEKIENFKQKFSGMRVVYLESLKGISSSGIIDKTKPILFEDKSLILKVEKLALKKAKESSESGYSYSGFKVGAAAIDEKNRIFVGCNLSNASPATALCAERIAVASAVVNRSRYIRKLVLYTNQEKIYTPCGLCRQVIAEFSSLNDPCKIILANKSGKIYRTNIDLLLPSRFESIRNLQNRRVN